MNPGQLLTWLEANDACTEAREWVAGKTLREAWEQCQKPSWMIWILRVGKSDLVDRAAEIIQGIHQFNVIDIANDLREELPADEVIRSLRHVFR